MDALTLAAAVPFPGWHLHLDVWLLVGLLSGGYWLALHRERARRGPDHAEDGVPDGPDMAPVATKGQVIAFAFAMLLMWAVSDWPVHDVAEGYLYSFHMVQHLVLTLGVALLLVAGTPAWLARRLLSPPGLLKVVRWLARPVPALIQFNLILVLSHWPVVVEATLLHHPLHFVAHAVLLGSAILMWLPIASPLPEVPRLAPPLQMLYLFLQTIVPTIPASFLTFGSKPLYPIYETFPRLWGISALTDQLTAGLIMKVGGGFFLWIVIAVIFFRWYAAEEKSGPGSPYQPDVLLWKDVEAELKRLEAESKTPPPPPA